MWLTPTPFFSSCLSGTNIIIPISHKYNQINRKKNVRILFFVLLVWSFSLVTHFLNIIFFYETFGYQEKVRGLDHSIRLLTEENKYLEIEYRLNYSVTKAREWGEQNGFKFPEKIEYLSIDTKKGKLLHFP